MYSTLIILNFKPLFRSMSIMTFGDQKYLQKASCRRSINPIYGVDNDNRHVNFCLFVAWFHFVNSSPVILMEMLKRPTGSRQCCTPRFCAYTRLHGNWKHPYVVCALRCWGVGRVGKPYVCGYFVWAYRVEPYLQQSRTTLFTICYVPTAAFTE